MLGSEWARQAWSGRRPGRGQRSWPVERSERMLTREWEEVVRWTEEVVRWTEELLLARPLHTLAQGCAPSCARPVAWQLSLPPSPRPL